MPRYFEDDDDHRWDIRNKDRNGPKRFSGLGLASLLIAIGSGLMLMGLIAMAVVIGNNDQAQGRQRPDNDPVAVLIGFGFLASLGAAVIGVVLGAVGCFQSNRQIALPILGTVFNAIILIGVVFAICLGLALA